MSDLEKVEKQAALEEAKTLEEVVMEVEEGRSLAVVANLQTRHYLLSLA